jgi:hypothetical protein
MQQKPRNQKSNQKRKTKHTHKRKMTLKTQRKPPSASQCRTTYTPTVHSVIPILQTARLKDGSSKSLSCDKARVKVLDTTTFRAGEIQLSGPCASILAVVKVFGVFAVGGGVGLAFTGTVDVAGTTEDFVEDALHQKGVCDLLMSVVGIQKFLFVSHVVMRGVQF